jgi:hypothetical protein
MKPSETQPTTDRLARLEQVLTELEAIRAVTPRDDDRAAILNATAALWNIKHNWSQELQA